ncbi:hypothetical protein Trydic_g6666 [Trypoxylus dichotomus]
MWRGKYKWPQEIGEEKVETFTGLTRTTSERMIVVVVREGCTKGFRYTDSPIPLLCRKQAAAFSLPSLSELTQSGKLMCGGVIQFFCVQKPYAPKDCINDVVFFNIVNIFISLLDDILFFNAGGSVQKVKNKMLCTLTFDIIPQSKQ